MEHNSLPGAVFLDRDGTLIEETEFLCRIEDIAVFPQAYEAVRQLNRSGIPAVVVTNQSAVARGLMSESDLQELHRYLAALFERNHSRLDAFYYCPHHPSVGASRYTRQCDCRKPRPGLLLRAAHELGVELTRSFVVGDRLRDLAAGAAVQTRGILVKTGYGRQELEAWREGRVDADVYGVSPDHVADHVLEAVSWILESAH